MSHNILSQIGTVLFTAMWLGTSAPGGQETATATDFNVILYAGDSYRLPLLDTKETWEPYAAAGIWLEMPTYITALSVRIGAEAGTMSAKPPYDLEMLLVHGTITAQYRMPFVRDRVAIRPFFGISNTTIYIRDQFKFNSRLFSSSENEFGPVLGLEPQVRIGRLRIAVPVYGEYVFSTPYPFITATVSLHAGVAF